MLRLARSSREGVLPLFLKISERRQVKNRVHLDLAAADLDSEVKRLVNLGATVVETYDSHVWRADPQGNGFCVTRATSP